MPINWSNGESPNYKKLSRSRYGEHLNLLVAPETSVTQFVFFGCFYAVMIWILLQHGEALWNKDDVNLWGFTIPYLLHPPNA